MFRRKKEKIIVYKYSFLFIVFLMLIYFAARFIFSSLFAFAQSDYTQEESTIRTSMIKINSIQSNPFSFFIFDSFFDSFNNDYLIDSNRTTLYRDNLAAAVYFPPNYTWQEADSAVVLENEKKFEELSFYDFSAPDYEKRCLENKCLEQKNGDLYFNGRSIHLPSDVKASEIAAISLGKLNKNWLVGFTLKQGESSYEGRVYRYDGKKFFALGVNGQISSAYFGLLGFGGEEDDFLVVYGAYKGAAYRVQKDVITDVSSFFDYRIMDGGFRPEVIRAEGDNYINWYIFSLTDSHPRLIKLWSNKEGQISGIMEYQNFVGDNGGLAATLLTAEENKTSLLMRNNNGSGEFKIFNDYGFKNQTEGTLFFSSNIYDSPVTLKKLSNSSLGSISLPSQGGTLMFSLDSENWQEVPLGQAIDKEFHFSDVDKFFLKVVFPPQENKFYSPFLNEVLFDLYYQK